MLTFYIQQIYNLSNKFRLVHVVVVVQMFVLAKGCHWPFYLRMAPAHSETSALDCIGHQQIFYQLGVKMWNHKKIKDFYPMESCPQREKKRPTIEQQALLVFGFGCYAIAYGSKNYKWIYWDWPSIQKLLAITRTQGALYLNSPGYQTPYTQSTRVLHPSEDGFSLFNFLHCVFSNVLSFGFDSGSLGHILTPKKVMVMSLHLC